MAVVFGWLFRDGFVGFVGRGGGGILVANVVVMGFFTVVADVVVLVMGFFVWLWW